jgi:hypothetical protein
LHGSALWIISAALCDWTTHLEIDRGGPRQFELRKDGTLFKVYICFDEP